MSHTDLFLSILIGKLFEHLKPDDETDRRIDLIVDLLIKNGISISLYQSEISGDDNVYSIQLCFSLVNPQSGIDILFLSSFFLGIDQQRSR